MDSLQKTKLNTEGINQVANAIINSKYLVAFTGAGISTESGIPDFRGKNGVWTRREKGLKPIPLKKPMNEIKPNYGHYFLVNLQRKGILKYLISQNTDNLHISSGFPTELISELHGNHSLLKCIECDLRIDKSEIGGQDTLYGPRCRTHKPSLDQPVCPTCRGRLISSIVNFNDPMPQKEMDESERQSLRCDTMLVIGSSLVVAPAADLPKIAKINGAKLIILNIGDTPLDSIADIKLEVKVGTFLKGVSNRIDELEEGVKK